MADSIILHVDLDAFFASCEEAQDPRLKGRPVVIGADPKGGKGRGIVSTANYEARKFGIHSAMPISWAFKRCPHAVFLRGNFSLYRRVSEKFFSYIKSLGFVFEKTSVDEGYIDLSGLSYKQASNLAQRIMWWIFCEERVTCSIGIGPNRRIAKIASDFEKPNGLTVVLPSDVISFLKPLACSKIPGIGPVFYRSLVKRGYRFVGDLQAVSAARLIEEFGMRRGRWLFRVARGDGSTTVGLVRERKSISAERTFSVNEGNHTRVREVLDGLTSKIWSRLGSISFKTVTVKIRYPGFETFTHQKSSKVPFGSLVEVQQVVRSLFVSNVSDRAVRLIGVRFNNFV